MRDLPIDPKCHARHMGLYAIEPGYLNGAVAHIRAGTWPTVSAARDEDRDRPLFRLTPDGIAVVPISGPILKGTSKFPHTNSIDARRSVRAAVRDKRAKAIVLHIDSPGGSAAGTQELADDVHAAAQLKPTLAHIDDLGASAAYWVAAQASSISVNLSGAVGSIGVFAVVEDLSEKAEMDGVTVHVVTTGEFKGAFVPGAPIPQKHLKELQREVDGVFAMFRESVERGRGAKGLRGEALEKVADGRVWMGADAQKRGLVDRVASLDQVLADVSGHLEQAEAKKRSERARRRAALNRARS